MSVIWNHIGKLSLNRVLAAVIEDAAVHNVTFPLFDYVLKPKVMGGWNLHLLSCPQLKSFVCLSSVRFVPTFIVKARSSHIMTFQCLTGQSRPNRLCRWQFFFMEMLVAYPRAQNLPGLPGSSKPWHRLRSSSYGWNSSNWTWRRWQHFLHMRVIPFQRSTAISGGRQR